MFKYSFSKNICLLELRHVHKAAGNRLYESKNQRDFWESVNLFTVLMSAQRSSTALFHKIEATPLQFQAVIFYFSLQWASLTVSQCGLLSLQFGWDLLCLIPIALTSTEKYTITAFPAFAKVFYFCSLCKWATIKVSAQRENFLLFFPHYFTFSINCINCWKSFKIISVLLIKCAAVQSVILSLFHLLLACEVASQQRLMSHVGLRSSLLWNCIE